jgi:hypothetical protein
VGQNTASDRPVGEEQNTASGRTVGVRHLFYLAYISIPAVSTQYKTVNNFVSTI